MNDWYSAIDYEIVCRTVVVCCYTWRYGVDKYTTPGSTIRLLIQQDRAGNTATITRAVQVKNTPPIGINTFTINSNNNANSTYAKAGDTLSLFLNVNNSIVSHTIQISNANVTDVTAFNNQIIITATVLDNPVESNIDLLLQLQIAMEPP